MTNLYILTTSDVPNNVILGHASFAKKAGFSPIFILPDRGNGDKYFDYYKEYSVIHTRTPFSNKNILTYIFSIISYSVSVYKLLFFKKGVKHVLAVDFEGTLSSFFLKARGVKIYTLVNDNFAVRYNLNYISFIIIRFFESLIYKLVSTITIFPDKSRVQLLGWIKPNKVVILPNILKDTITTRYQGNADDTLIVLVCGLLVKTRGLDLLKKLLEYTSEKVKFLLVGSGDMTSIDELTCSQRVTFIGLKTREKTLELMSSIDINFAFYNPSTLINRYAMPQKVYDSLSIGCPIFINSEVKMADSLFKSGSAFSAGYWDIVGISSILNLLVNNKNLLKQVSERCIAFNEKSISYNTVENIGVEMYKNLLKKERFSKNEN